MQITQNALVAPLFETGDELPVLAKQLNIEHVNIQLACKLNNEWHSRLPKITNAQNGFAFAAEYAGRIYAIAIWTPPIARMLNGRGWLELRRMAICDDAPRYTATYMLAKMVKRIRKEHPEIVKLISYQDTEVHSGTIYKAGNWVCTVTSNAARGTGWNSRLRNEMQAPSEKVRWEYDLRKPES